MKAIDVAIAIVAHAGRLLICRRRQGDSFGGFWEFPGGKVEADETIEQCLVREVQEELLLRIKPLTALTVIEHDYPTVRVRLHPYICQLMSGEAQAVGCQEFRWVDPASLGDYNFPAANGALIEQLAARCWSDEQSGNQ